MSPFQLPRCGLHRRRTNIANSPVYVSKTVEPRDAHQFPGRALQRRESHRTGEIDMRELRYPRRREFPDRHEKAQPPIFRRYMREKDRV
jgi:hypothetical protein